MYGIRQLHSLGWIHADVKPENMFWGLDDAGCMHVYQADMGAAAPIDRPAQRASTMAWCAVRGLRDVDGLWPSSGGEGSLYSGLRLLRQPCIQDDSRLRCCRGGTREYMSPSRAARYALRDFTASDADDAYGVGATMLQVGGRMVLDVYRHSCR
jgi:serine/threonine protein kinase